MFFLAHLHHQGCWAYLFLAPWFACSLVFASYLLVRHTLARIEWYLVFNLQYCSIFLPLSLPISFSLIHILPPSISSSLPHSDSPFLPVCRYYLSHLSQSMPGKFAVQAAAAIVGNDGSEGAINGVLLGIRKGWIGTGRMKKEIKYKREKQLF